MKNEKVNQIFFEYNNILKENDEIYRNVAKTLGLSECTFWILYVLRTEQAVLSQSEICSYLYQPKQTVNSALKKLEANGYINLIYKNDRRSKQIQLTQKGTALAEKTVDRVIAQERSALLGLSDSEQETLIQLFRKYTDILKSRIQTIDIIQEENNK